MNDTLYIGYTNDLKNRLTEHNDGLSKATKRYKPWRLVYTEGYRSKEDAIRREHNLKYFGKAYGQLKGRIRDSLLGA